MVNTSHFKPKPHQQIENTALSKKKFKVNNIFDISIEL